jgi:glucan phosphoethanolaminetransferase (alkaline phosphatase superfamily)
MKDLSSFLLLLVPLGFGALFGRYTTKPLWWAAIAPTAAVLFFSFLFLVQNEQPHRWVEAFLFVSPFIVGACVFYGGLSYFSARENRGSDIKPAINLEALQSLGLLKGKTMYFVILLIAVSMSIEVWKKYFA